MHQLEQAVDGPTNSSSLQGYPDENEESLRPRILGVGKWQLYGRAVETVQTARLRLGEGLKSSTSTKTE